MVRRLSVLAGAVAVTLLLTACANDALAAQYRSGSGQNYISGDGAVSEFPPESRGAPVNFAGTLNSGVPVTSTQYLGQVLVVNFWYAGCPPCRAEARDLQAISQQYAAQGVSFLGVNIRDQSEDTAKSYEKTFGVTYGSFMDARTGSISLAFSGVVGPNAVPTTLVLDRQGRVAARILGRVSTPSTLEALIKTALAEGAR